MNTDNFQRRLISFFIAAAIHIVPLVFLVITVKTAVQPPAEKTLEMKLVDVTEAPPPPPVRRPVAAESITEEAIAETVVETDEVSVQASAAAGAAVGTGAAIDYLPMRAVSKLPKFDEAELRSRLPYPEMAKRAGIEGQVILELFVDSGGNIRNIVILKETPEERGFGEAAVKAFSGLRAEPAQAGGEIVAVRYRYPVRFKLR
jgi:protein TonB